LDTVLEHMDIKTIDIVTYSELANYKNGEHVKHVVFHLINDIDKIRELETPLFDVFLIQKKIDTELSGYIKDEFAQFTVFTKTIQE